MKNKIYFNIYGRKASADLLEDLKKGIANDKAVDERALSAIKIILASRNLTTSEKEVFDNLTQGETFEKIENAEVHEQPAEDAVVLEPKKLIRDDSNWLRWVFGVVSYLLLKYIYFDGYFPSFWMGVLCFSLGYGLFMAFELYFLNKK